MAVSLAHAGISLGQRLFRIAVANRAGRGTWRKTSGDEVGESTCLGGGLGPTPSSSPPPFASGFGVVPLLLLLLLLLWLVASWGIARGRFTAASAAASAAFGSKNLFGNLLLLVHQAELLLGIQWRANNLAGILEGRSVTSRGDLPFVLNLLVPNMHVEKYFHHGMPTACRMLI